MFEYQVQDHEEGEVVDPQVVSKLEQEGGKDALKELENREREYWSKFLGVPAELPPMPAGLTAELAERFKDDPENMGIRSFPMLDIGTLDDMKTLGVNTFLARIQQRYPGLHVFDELSDEEKKDHSVGRLLEESYWQEVMSGLTLFPEGYKKGGWLLAEVMPKADCKEVMAVSTDDVPYGMSMISEEIRDDHRLNKSWLEAHAGITMNKLKILSRLGLPMNHEVRLPTVEEYNLLANRDELGKTNSYEWTDTPRLAYSDKCYLAGDSSQDRGAADATSCNGKYSYYDVGYRIVVDLTPMEPQKKSIVGDLTQTVKKIFS